MMFENVDGRTYDGVIGILIAHLGAFGSGELITQDIFHRIFFSNYLIMIMKFCANLGFYKLYRVHTDPTKFPVRRQSKFPWHNSTCQRKLIFIQTFAFIAAVNTSVINLEWLFWILILKFLFKLFSMSEVNNYVFNMKIYRMSNYCDKTAV